MRKNDNSLLWLWIWLFGVSPPPSLLESVVVVTLPEDCCLEDSGHDHSETKEDSHFLLVASPAADYCLPVLIQWKVTSTSESSALLGRKCPVAHVGATLPFRSTKTKLTLLIQYTRLAFCFWKPQWTRNDDQNKSQEVDRSRFLSAVQFNTLVVSVSGHFQFWIEYSSSTE